MESTNGTYLNGKRVKKSKINPGDKVTIADVDIVVEESPSPLEGKRAPLDVTVTLTKRKHDASAIRVKNPSQQLFRKEGQTAPDVDRSYSALQTLYRADKVLRDIEDFKQLLDNFMDLIMDVIPASRGYIFLLDKDSRLPVPFVRRAPDTAGSDTEIVVSKTIIKAAVEQKESIISNDALVDERFVHSRSVTHMQVRSAMCAPLVNRDKVLGIIYLDSTSKSNLYTKEDLALLSAMALKAGIALDNARLYDDMRNLFFSTVETLVRAIQARDEYTSGHSARVTRYCLLIADKLGLGTKEKHQLYLTSMLHDIGKIGIPDDILNRPGKLNAEEIAKVRDHVRVGATMLAALGEMHAVVPLILHHHEAWNGSGYPDGLKGEAIPLISRIVAVADTYDAMTSNRPYRQARSKEAAVAELERCAGELYDPEVVKAFLEILNEHSAVVSDDVPHALI
jgi:HD-GYP domain-containing protein (c-di-GMP phosphodiesterase class II)